MRKTLTFAVIAIALLASTRGLMGQTLNAPVPPYTLRAGDILRLKVWPDSTRNGDYPVEEDGKVAFPGLGRLQITGVPYQTIREQLEAKYALTMTAPVVILTPLVRVSVLGAVSRPGLYQISPTHSLVDVIAMAGGFAPGAKQSDVEVARNGSIQKVNADSLRASGGTLVNLRSGDQIFVPMRKGIDWSSVRVALQAATLIVGLLNLRH
jgi:polysaccharide export outer membrane protein